MEKKMETMISLGRRLWGLLCCVGALGFGSLCLQPWNGLGDAAMWLQGSVSQKDGTAETAAITKSMFPDFLV